MNLERAIAIATQAHDGKKDKGGAQYILHPLRVMRSVTGEEAKIVAVLHDVIEDSDWTFGHLRAEGFSETVLAALECVTKRDGESYDAFVDRAAANPIARAVKIADLEDNLDKTRLATVAEKDQARLAKYRAAHKRLTGFSEGSVGTPSV